MAGAAVEFAQGFEDLIDGDRSLRPAGARSAGQEAIADASDAQDARMARFSEIVRDECANTSLG
jgi:hypothetical protein